MIPLNKPFFDEEELEQISKVFESGWVSQGPKNIEFEEKVCKYLGVKYAIPVCNATAALHLSLLAIGVGPGDEVIVPDFTFPATSHSVLYCNAKPVFVDVTLDTFNIDPSKIEENVNENTKAIIAVDAFGHPADLDEIKKIARKYKLVLIEDAACAFGAKYKEKFCGTIADITCFSFHGRKGITTGEGGMVVTSNEEIANKIRHLSVFGMDSALKRSKEFSIPIFTDIGYNYKMSDIAAAVGIAQLDKLESIIEKKSTVSNLWKMKLFKFSHIMKIPVVRDYVRHCWQSFVVILDPTIGRDNVIKFMMNKNIYTTFGTYCCSMQPVYKSKNVCPNSKFLFEHTLSLPIYYSMDFETIDYVSNILEKSLWTSNKKEF